MSMGVSSTTHSYNMGGGIVNGGAGSNIIEKWSHAVDGNATDIGDLTATKGYLGGAGAQI